MAENETKTTTEKVERTETVATPVTTHASQAKGAVDVAETDFSE